jgi:hypothetical protein
VSVHSLEHEVTQATLSCLPWVDVEGFRIYTGMVTLGHFDYEVQLLSVAEQHVLNVLSVTYRREK